MKPLSYYAASARETISQYGDRDDLFKEIDEAIECYFETPPELKKLPWIGERQFATTAAADAHNAAVRTFASKMPQLNISPLSDEEEEHARVELLETAMAWDFERQNMLRKKSVLWNIVSSAMAYCAVAIQTEYLPYSMKGVEKTERVKSILRSRAFNWTVHHPGTVYARESDRFGLESVVKACVYSAQDIIDNFGLDNPGVKKMLKELNLDDPEELQQTTYSFFDLMDWDTRAIWISNNSGSWSLNKDAPAGIELLREARKETFIPWVVIDNGEPILKPIIKSGLYKNINIMRTMMFSRAVDQAAHPDLDIATPDGTLRGVSIDNTNPSQPLVHTQNTQVTQLRPPMLDPQLSSMEQLGESEMFRSTVAQILASVEKYSSAAAYATVDAMLKAAVSQLALSQATAERAIELGNFQNFQWIEYSDIPYIAYRSKTVGDSLKAGQEIKVDKDSFDTDYLYIKVKLVANTVGDEQMKVTNAINKVERLNMSRERAWEELGMENYELNATKRAEEDMFLTVINEKNQEVMNRAQLMLQAGMAQIQTMVQQAQAQMQQQMQPPQQSSPQNMASEMANPNFSASQGIDNRNAPPQSGAPGVGREQITGKTYG